MYEAYQRAFHNIANTVTCFEAEWWHWLERQEESYRDDKSTADFVILEGGIPIGVGLKLVEYSRNLKETRDGDPFDKGTCPLKSPPTRVFKPSLPTSFILLLLRPS